jgi:iron complex outermembrane receptor protein
VSIEAGTRAYNGPVAEIIGSVGSSDGKFGIVAGADLWPDQHFSNGAGGDYGGGGLVARWSPANNVKLSAFGTLEYWVADPDIGLVPDGEFLPHRIARGVYRGQRWGKYDNRNQTAGLFGKANLGNGWKLSGGGFYSATQYTRADFNFLEVHNPAGDYHSYLFVTPRRSSSANSASMLLERSWGSGLLRHRIVATIRYRRTINLAAPSLAVDTGIGNLLGDYPQIPEPDLAISADRNRDVILQTTVGVGYRIGIGKALEFRADVQKTDYSHEHHGISGAVSTGTSRPLLYSGSALWGVTDKLALFGSYSRGLEESGVAPNSAINSGEVLPAVIATQRELGARYRVTPKLSLIAGLFDTRKPTPGKGPDGRFDLVGEVRHRGFEASLAGALTPRLDILAGVMILDATLSGPLVEQGLIGRHAVARPDHTALLNLNWRPKWADGLSLDATVNHLGRAYISSSNVTKSELQTTLDVGARYRFNLGKQPVSLRMRVRNVFDSFYWQPDSSGTLYPNSQRGLDLTLQTEL